MDGGGEIKNDFPPELLSHRSTVEEYVEKRIRHCLNLFASKYGNGVPPDGIAAAIDDVLGSRTSVATTALAINTPAHLPLATDMGLQLVFKHDCLSLGCRDPECMLCQYNPLRMCDRNFCKKYLVGDVLKSKCTSSLKLELSSTRGIKAETDELAGLQLEVCLIDGVLFKEKGGENRTLSFDEVRACVKFTNHRDEALLQLKSGVVSNNRRILLRPERGSTLLPELQVTDSSEALLTGRRPPFRLLALAVQEDGNPASHIGYAVSEDFVVATRRVKQANKADIPLMDDHVSKIEHIGRETVKKLQDLRSASAETGMPLNLPDQLMAVTTVGQFLQLVQIAEKDTQLQKVLQVTLKLSKEKWDEAAAHALTAVVSDFRKRIWYPPTHAMNLGVLFNCKYGSVQLKDPVSLVHMSGPAHSGGAKVIPEDDLDPQSLDFLRSMKVQAVEAWWQDRHPGWGVFKGAAPEQAKPDPAAAMKIESMLNGLAALAQASQHIRPTLPAHTHPAMSTMHQLPPMNAASMHQLSAAAAAGSFPFDTQRLQQYASLGGSGHEHEQLRAHLNAAATKIMAQSQMLGEQGPSGYDSAADPSSLYTPFATSFLPNSLQQEIAPQPQPGCGAGHGNGEEEDGGEGEDGAEGKGKRAGGKLGGASKRQHKLPAPPVSSGQTAGGASQYGSLTAHLAHLQGVSGPLPGLPAPGLHLQPGSLQSRSSLPSLPMMSPSVPGIPMNTSLNQAVGGPALFYYLPSWSLPGAGPSGSQLGPFAMLNHLGQGSLGPGGQSGDVRALSALGSMLGLNHDPRGH